MHTTFKPKYPALTWIASFVMYIVIDIIFYQIWPDPDRFGPITLTRPPSAIVIIVIQVYMLNIRIKFFNGFTRNDDMQLPNLFMALVAHSSVYFLVWWLGSLCFVELIGLHDLTAQLFDRFYLDWLKDFVHLASMRYITHEAYSAFDDQ